MAKLANEQRRHTRRGMSVCTWLRFHTEMMPWGTVTQDIGREGARFSTMRPIVEGEHALLTLQLEPTAKAIECKGQVCWLSRGPDEMTCFGVRFMDLNEDEQAALDCFLEHSGATSNLALR